MRKSQVPGCGGELCKAHEFDRFHWMGVLRCWDTGLTAVTAVETRVDRDVRYWHER